MKTDKMVAFPPGTIGDVDSLVDVNCYECHVDLQVWKTSYQLIQERLQTENPQMYCYKCAGYSSMEEYEEDLASAPLHIDREYLDIVNSYDDADELHVVMFRHLATGRVIIDPAVEGALPVMKTTEILRAWATMNAESLGISGVKEWPVQKLFDFCHDGIKQQISAQNVSLQGLKEDTHNATMLQMILVQRPENTKELFMLLELIQQLAERNNNFKTSYIALDEMLVEGVEMTTLVNNLLLCSIYGEIDIISLREDDVTHPINQRLVDFMKKEVSDLMEHIGKKFLEENNISLESFWETVNAVGAKNPLKFVNGVGDLMRSSAVGKDFKPEDITAWLKTRIEKVYGRKSKND